MPFLNVAKQNRKGVTYVHQFTVSRILCSLLPLCQNLVRPWSYHFQNKAGAILFTMPRVPIETTDPIGTKPVFIEFAIPRIQCLICQIIRQVKVGFADIRRAYTYMHRVGFRDFLRQSCRKRVRI